ncbi:MAG TPA: SCO1664 family protein [Oryzihumus sp.]|nr:SCO1664 family protein [Oryzihumus sp.]
MLELLTLGEIEVQGRLVDASNLALLTTVEHAGRTAHAMYKPVRGERPLWDFPEGTLAGRETAAWVVSEAGGWGVVPPTVLREGPLGPGSVQLWIGPAEEDVDLSAQEALIDVVPRSRVRPGWLPVFEGETHEGEPVVVVHADRPDLASTAVLDAAINNADRKGSHLRLEAGSLWGFDHGVSFNVEPKLRTVLWGWMGQPLPERDLERLGRLSAELDAESSAVRTALAPLLTVEEVEALRARVSRLLGRGRFPRPGGAWPAVPWPPL